MSRSTVPKTNENANLFILRYIASLEALFVHTKHRLKLCFVTAFQLSDQDVAETTHLYEVASFSPSKSVIFCDVWRDVEGK